MAKPSKTLTTASDNFVLGTYVDPITSTNPFSNGTGGWYGIIDGGVGSDSFTADFSSASENLTMAISGTSRTFKSLGSINITAANFESFTITAGSGNDTLVGGTSNDTLYGGAGNDVFNVGAVSGTNLYDGGTGNDLLIASWSAFSSSITLSVATGTTTNTIAGSTFTNFESLSVTTGIGDDVITTNVTVRYNDIISTGAGNDFVTIGFGNDRTDGGSGTDTLNLDMSANTGSVKYSTTAVAGYTAGYTGQNISIGYRNFEIYNITGTAYNDSLNGGSGDDTIKGGAGNDTINSGTGNDSIDGGAGNDTWIFDFSNSSTGLSINANATVATNVATGMTSYMNVEVLNGNTGAGNDSVTIKDNVILNDKVSLGAGDDTLSTTGTNLGTDIFDGGIGTDTLTINMSAAVAASGGIYTTLSGTTYTIDGTATSVKASNFEKFNITTGAGLDEIYGGSGADTIISGAGNDTIYGGGGADSIDGGAGTDVFSMDLSTSLAAIKFTSTAAGVATYTYTGVSGVTVNNIEEYRITTGSGNDVLTDSTTANDIFFTGAGNDIVNIGYGGVDIVDGGTGNDKLIIDWTGTTATHQLIHESLDESFMTGYQVYHAGASSYYAAYRNFELFEIHGGAGNDMIVGGTQADFLEGNAGADVIRGDAGDDSLRGDRADAAAGTFGRDIFIATLNGGTDTILDAAAGAVADYISSETIEFTKLTVNSTVSGDTVGLGEVEVNKSSTGQSVVYIGMDINQGADQVFILNGDYTTGTRFVLEAGSLKITGVGTQPGGGITGTSGDDSLTGTTANETILGKAGNDTIDGGAGADAITGGLDSDYMTGGAGIDTFIFTSVNDSTAGDYDTITDFVSGTDIIKLTSIDPNPVLAGDQAFVFNATGAFTGVRGEIIYNSATNMLQADINADGVADFAIKLLGVASLTSADFTL
jgi:Ca2+-binding RTX toxin-like protein